MDLKELLKLIQEDTKKKKDRYLGRAYYKYKPDSNKITSVDIVDQSGNIKSIKLENKNKLFTNYFKLLVKQKRNYLLSKGPTVKNTLFELPVLTDLLDDAILNSSLDSRTWLYLYVENNDLQYVFVHDSEVIPLYDRYNKKIVSIIRYYYNSSKEKVLNVELWELTGVTYLTIENNIIVEEIKTLHYKVEDFFNSELVDEKEYNLPFLPFIPMFNNKEKESDLEGIQDLLDMYNQINSGLIDNIDKFQEALMKLKGFSGDDNTLKTTMANLKRYKAAGIPSDGDMEYISIEIPVEARKFILDLLIANIFKLGQGFDPDKIGDGNITNVVITSRYAGIENKSNETEKQLQLFYINFMTCYEQFYKTKYDKTLTCNRDRLVNEVEKIDSCVKSMNMVSLDTILKNHPWVTNIEEEKAKIKQDEQAEVEKFKNDPRLNTNPNLDIHNEK